jgi:hypothetical protein
MESTTPPVRSNRRAILAAVAAVVGSLVLVVPAAAAFGASGSVGTNIISSGGSSVPPPSSPPPSGGSSCGFTLGFWKNHTDVWVGYAPSAKVGDVFSNASPYASTSLLNALKFQGGDGIDGGKRILLKQAVAALLNASAGINYPLGVGDVISQVSAALGSGDRDTMTNLADQLNDFNNNEVCSL